jgi:hypothetical protein
MKLLMRYRLMENTWSLLPAVVLMESAIGDLYISVRKNDTWSKPKNMGALINHQVGKANLVLELMACQSILRATGPEDTEEQIYGWRNKLPGGELVTSCPCWTTNQHCE